MESRTQLLDDSNKKQGIDISFHNIIYSVDVEDKTQEFHFPWEKSKNQKALIKGISGIFKAGELTAIMGSSGAGKTTLLNIVAGRVNKFEGTLFANHTPFDFDTFGTFANYVMQNDVLLQTMTVRETLEFAARFKLDSQQEINQRVDKLVKKLQLQKCLDVLIGGPVIKGISGGQKKRTSIAFELISDPQVLALDQPTSGLDSLTSFIIIENLRQLARDEGKTIFLTIHQPGTEIFNLFDTLLLMVQGQLIYQGKADFATQYFAINFGLKCPEYENPGDYFMSIMHQGIKQNVERVPEYIEKYDKLLAPQIQIRMADKSFGQIRNRQNKLGPFSLLRILLKRDLLNIIRNPMTIKSRVFTTVFLAIYVGGLYFNDGRNSYTDTFNWSAIVGFLFFMQMDMFFQTLVPVTLVFPLERQVFLKQENSKMYGLIPYFLSRNILQIPYSFITPFIFQVILYWMVGLSSTAQQFFTMYLTLILHNFAASSLGLLVGSIILDPKSVSTFVTLFALPLTFFCGLFKNVQSMPYWYGWIRYISPFYHSFSAITQNQVLFKPSNVAQLNFQLGIWPSIGVLAGLGVAFRVSSCIFLWLMKSRLQ